MRLLTSLLLLVLSVGCTATHRSQGVWEERFSQEVDRSEPPVERLAIIAAAARFRPAMMNTPQGKRWREEVVQTSKSNDPKSAQFGREILELVDESVAKPDSSLHRTPPPKWWEAPRNADRPTDDVIRLIQTARRQEEAGDRAAAMLSLRAADAAAMRHQQDAGPTLALVRVAQAYFDLKESALAEDAIRRASSEAEENKDAFYYGIGNYGMVIACCREAGRPDLIEDVFAKLSRPLERGAFCLAALANADLP